MEGRREEREKERERAPVNWVVAMPRRRPVAHVDSRFSTSLPRVQHSLPHSPARRGRGLRSFPSFDTKTLSPTVCDITRSFIRPPDERRQANAYRPLSFPHNRVRGDSLFSSSTFFLFLPEIIISKTAATDSRRPSNFRKHNTSKRNRVVVGARWVFRYARGSRGKIGTSLTSARASALPFLRIKMSDNLI